MTQRWTLRFAPIIGAVLGLPLLWLAAPAAMAQSGPEVSLLAGYGISAKVNRSRTEEQLLIVQPQAAWKLGRRLDWLVEGHFAQYFRPDGWAAGLVPVSARYLFAIEGVAPYFGLGVGFGWTNLEIEEIDRRFNFILQGGFGVRGSVRKNRAWIVEARWLHYSNAGTVKPNLGFNAVVLMGGWRFR